MQTILVALQDPVLRDQVRIALKMFPTVRGTDVPRNRLLDILRERAAPVAAVIIDHEAGKHGGDRFLEELRDVDREVPILAVADLPERGHFNKTKVELDIFSFIPLPLDPFDLLRRLHRLVGTLSAAR